MYCGLVLKEDKGDVIRSNPRHIDTCCRSNEVGVDLAVQSWIYGCLAMLGRYDYQGLVIDVFGFEGGHDFA